MAFREVQSALFSGHHFVYTVTRQHPIKGLHHSLDPSCKCGENSEPFAVAFRLKN